MCNPGTMALKPKKPVASGFQSTSRKVAFLTGSRTLHNETVYLRVRGKSIHVEVDSEGNPVVIRPPK